MPERAVTEAIRKTVLVDFAPAEAFELFTTRVSSWWPTATHSYGARQGHGRRLRAPRRRAALRGDRRGHGRVGQDHGLGAAAPARDGVADRQGRRHRGRGALLARGAGLASRSSSTAGGSASPTRPRARATRRLGRRAGALRRERVEEGLKPAQPLGPRHGRVRRRGRGKHEERRLAEAALLQPELGPLAERAAVGLLADEADRARRSSSAIRSSRSAEPAKSAWRRSPEPGVVR